MTALPLWPLPLAALGFLAFAGYAGVSLLWSPAPGNGYLKVSWLALLILTAGLVPNAASAYFQIPSGTSTFTFRESSTGNIVATLPDVSLLPGQTNTGYALGPAGALAGRVRVATR